METNPSSSSSSLSSPPAKRFCVFLSFSGADTRYNFTSHLSLALRKIGLFNIFKDEDALDRGKNTVSELLKAIENSQYAVVVLSNNYATSIYCLKELAKIVECMGDSGRIQTIFYHINPDHVKNLNSDDEKKQKESSFWDALQEHAKNPSHSKEVESWRNALVQVANQFAHPVKADTDEAIFIEEFVAKISSKLGPSITAIDGLFGMTSRIKKLDSCVLQSLETNDVCFIGIYGMGGIGKSTLAEAYHMMMSHEFHGNSFLANVREVCAKQANGLEDLQKKLLRDILEEDFQVKHLRIGINFIRSRLRNMKVLIILDDVNDPKQLEALADSHRKKQESENELDIWFGRGSVIIVTTRNEDLLTKRYEKCIAECLDDNEALQLFSWKAFESIEPPEEFKQRSKEVVKNVGNLPLALTVLGTLLGLKKKSQLEGAFRRLEKCIGREILENLKISFDDLDPDDQCIFLDIACFFKGCNKYDVIEILDNCGFDSQYGISNLIGRSLLSINEVDEIQMHDLLEEMGKYIVRKASDNELGRQSRIWDSDELHQVLQNKGGTDKVEAIIVTGVVRSYSVEDWSFMKKLRLLHVEDFGIIFPWQGDCNEPELSNNLQYLKWKGFPYNKLPSSFQPLKLGHLELQRSNIKQLWNIGIEPLYNLKVINLTGSPCFVKFEDFTVVPNLKKLILSKCRSLLEIDPSIKHLKELIVLELKGCSSLQKLPEDINGLTSLQTLNLCKCPRIKKLPNNLEQLKSLRNLKIDEATITSVIQEDIISYRSTGKIGLYPGWFYTSLTSLFLIDCNLSGPEAFPEYFGKLVSLTDLYLNKNPFSVLPAGIKGFTNLTTLVLTHCQNLKCLEPEILPSSLKVVYVDFCTSLGSFLDPLKPCDLRCSAYCLDCTELVKRQNGKMTALASLSRFLEDPSRRRNERFNFVAPQSDNELPSWFINQSLTASIRIKLDPNRRNSELIGVAMVFCFRATPYILDISCNIRIRRSTNWITLTTITAGFIESRMSDHLSLLYRPCIYTLECIKQLEPQSCDTLEFSFLSTDGERCFLCGACSVRLVYEEDIEELKHIISQYVKVQNDVQSSHSHSVGGLSKLTNVDLEHTHKVGDLELVERQDSKDTTLAISSKTYLQDQPNPSTGFDIVIPGNDEHSLPSKSSEPSNLSLERTHCVDDLEFVESEDSKNKTLTKSSKTYIQDEPNPSTASDTVSLRHDEHSSPSKRVEESSIKKRVFKSRNDWARSRWPHSS